MNDEVNTIINRRLKELPLQTLEVIKSIPLQEILKNVSQINNLTDDQIDLFETETVLIILGLVSPTDYPENLVRMVGLNEASAIKIAKEVGEQIFNNLKGAAKKNGATKTEPQQPPQNQTLESPTHLIEDAEGNKDNILPPIPQKTTLEQKIAPIVNGAPEVNPDWEKRKGTLGEHSVMTETYGGKDPYREPLG